jgi:uncharacterized protein DUF4197
VAERGIGLQSPGIIGKKETVMPAKVTASRAGRAPLVGVAGLAILACLGAAPGTPAGAGLDATTAANGLKEALGIGASRSVELLGRPDGYLKNPDVRIPMPEKLQLVGKSLQTIGKGAIVDEFVTSMNRAAEAAAPQARRVFLDTIRQMSFADALRIAGGKEHEATDFLRTNASSKLSTLFHPIVAEQLDKVGTTRSFSAMMGSAANLPFGGKGGFHLEDYVTDKALDGMFLMIGREEEKIRKDPVARTTGLLKKVFGAAGESRLKNPPPARTISPPGKKAAPSGSPTPGGSARPG